MYQGTSRVRPYFVILGFLAVSLVVSLPLAVSLLGLVKPCMPPLLSSMMILDCKDWDDDGDSSFLTRLGIGVFEYYTWLVIISTLSYGLYIPLLYPVEIKLFILEVMKQ